MNTDWAELLMKDHETTERVFEATLNAFEAPGGPPTTTLRAFVQYVTEYLDACHHKKEEDHLFPLLEQRGIPRSGGPLAVMLGEHEQSREILPRVRAAAERYLAGDAGVKDELRAAIAEYAELLKGHFWKENDILFPMGRRLFGPEDAAAVVRGIEATEAACGSDTRARYYALAREIEQAGALKDLSFGLDGEVIAAMLNALPVEISFVDENDTVRYFSHENGTKIFPRTRGAIGTAVQNCHPQKSVHVVNRILSDFKAGRREVSEFWIDMGGKKIHIRYFPVRSPEGRYLGCMEVVQDITRIQGLSGQRRLLDEP